jgi:hypothetical protein
MPIRTFDVLKLWYLFEIRKSDVRKFDILQFWIHTSNVVKSKEQIFFSVKPRRRIGQGSFHFL